MGLFRSVLKAVPGIGSIFSAGSSKKAVSSANAATQAGIAQAQAALNDQFAQTSANLNPWITTGQQANAGAAGLLGLNGDAAQETAIAQLQASPLFQSLMRNGTDTVLGNASATGGLRGGNTSGALANLGTDTLAQVIQNQLTNLGGVSSQGLGAANQLGAFGANNAGGIAGLYGASGSANAGSILGRQAIDNQLFSGIRSQIESAVAGGAGLGAGGIRSIISRLGIGGSSAPDFTNLNASTAGTIGGINAGFRLAPVSLPF